MLNIDGINYQGSIKESIVSINDEWKEVLVLKIEKDLDDVSIIKHNNMIYKIDKIINRYEDNTKWLLINHKSEDIEAIEKNNLKNEVKETKKTIEELESKNKINLLAMMEVNSRLRQLEEVVKND